MKRHLPRSAISGAMVSIAVNVALASAQSFEPTAPAQSAGRPDARP
jgi:hypothetical protein